MKIINRQNFLSYVCISYTFISLSKILIEYFSWGKFGNDEANLIRIFFISCAAVLVLSQHYRLQKIPFLLVIIGQYVILTGGVLLYVWIGSFFEPVHPNGYFDMFRSFTLFYVILAVCYYIEVFREIRKANMILRQLESEGEEYE